MNRIEKTFRELKDSRNKAFIPFFVVGDPNPTLFLQIIKEIEPYADIIELGIPYSDPIADGPVIQEANKRAFASHMDFTYAIELINKIREFTQKPIVILTYANVIGVNERMKKTLSQFASAGVDGIIVADLPIEESDEFYLEFQKNDINMIHLVAPTTTNERLEHILSKAEGFLYLIALKGVTGAREMVLEDTKNTITRITHQISKFKGNSDEFLIPICLGFGLSKPEHIKEVIELGVDGVIVGSAIIKQIENNLADSTAMKNELLLFINSMKVATKVPIIGK